jgi:cold shock CspA family protein
MTENRVKGRIIKVSKEGWGFISSKEIEFTRIFFHWTSLKQSTLGFKELKTGMIVEFTPMQIEGKGWRAHHVDVIDKREKKDVPETSEEVPVVQVGSEDVGASHD